MDMRDLFSMPSPDVFVVSYQVWRAARDRGQYPQGSPLLAVEVVSPSNQPKNVSSKTALYLSAGTPVVWNVYPDEKYVSVHTPTGIVEWKLGQMQSLAPVLPYTQLDAAVFFHLA